MASTGVSAQALDKRLPTQPPRKLGQIEILSDTMGVSFDAYLAQVVSIVRQNWYPLVPEEARAPISKTGKVAVDFAISRDGGIQRMQITSSSGDESLDRAAFASIAKSSPFQPLPSAFGGEYLGLRFHFSYNPLSVSILLPLKGTTVLAGASAPVAAKVTGSKNTAVKWSVAGTGCSGAGCGVIEGDTYLSPAIPPNPHSVTLTAASEVDPTVSDAVDVIVASASEIRISPAFAQAYIGAALHFVALLGKGSVPVNWSVVGPGCTGRNCGTISLEGVYLAPLRAPHPPTVTVTAKLKFDPAKTASATVEILQPGSSH